MKHAWLIFHGGDVETERLQCEQEGKEIGPLLPEFERLSAADLANPAEQTAFGELMDRAAQLPVRAGYPYVEPSDLEGIRAERPAGEHGGGASRIGDAELEDRVAGAWLGRCAGCLLGKPVEGWRRPARKGEQRQRTPLAVLLRKRGEGVKSIWMTLLASISQGRGTESQRHRWQRQLRQRPDAGLAG